MKSWIIGLLVLFVPGVVYAMSEQDCRRLYSYKAYERSAHCFGALFKRKKSPSLLNNQALVLRTWAKQLKQTNPTKSCQLRLRALALYKAYMKKIKGVEVIRVRATIQGIVDGLSLGQMTLVSTPSEAKVSLIAQGHPTKKHKTPVTIDGLCPGVYKLVLHKKGHLPLVRQLSVKGGQKQVLHLLLQQPPSKEKPTSKKPPKRPVLVARRAPVLARPPFLPRQCPNVAPGAITLGVAGLLLGGGITVTVLGVSALQKVDLTTPGWRERYTAAETPFVVAYSSLYAGTGVAALVGTILLLTMKEPCSPKAPRISIWPNHTTHRAWVR